MSLFATLREAARKRIAYRRTLNELRALPAHLADDVAIQPGDERAIAHRAVYG